MSPRRREGPLVSVHVDEDTVEARQGAQLLAAAKRAEGYSARVYTRSLQAESVTVRMLVLIVREHVRGREVERRKGSLVPCSTADLDKRDVTPSLADFGAELDGTELEQPEG